MKSIIYLIIAVMLSSIVVFSFPKQEVAKKNMIILQCLNSSPKHDQLRQSGEILENRLEDYGLKNVTVTPLYDQGVIALAFPYQVNKKEIIPLITQRGAFGFYETYNRMNLRNSLQGHDSLFLGLHVPAESQGMGYSPAVLGYYTAQSKTEIQDYLAKHPMDPMKDIQYLWSVSPDPDGHWLLYGVKSGSHLNRSDLSHANVTLNKQNGNPELLMSFNRNGIPAWQDLTRRNIGNSIALVVDGAVYIAPQVKSEIKNGQCMVAGQFTARELKLLSSILNHPELPLDFKVVE